MTITQLLELERSLDLEAKMHGLTGLEEKFTLFYDETNNIRKLHIREDDGLNVSEFGDFVLGGIVCNAQTEILDFESLRLHLSLDKGINDLKLKHIAKGGFLDIISSKKLCKFLGWIVDRGILVHHFHLDPLYWSVVDIVDSILYHKPEFTQFVFHLKADLYEVIKPDIAAVISIFAKYNYPDIHPESVRLFVEELIERIEPNRACVPDFNFKMLKDVLKLGKDLPNLEFIEGYKAKKLIERFDIFYVHRLLMFKNAVHIFDNEPQVADGLLGSSVILEKFNSSLKFVESEESFEIQLSDVFAGISGKMYTYLRNTGREEVLKIRRNLDSVGRGSLELIELLSSASEIKCKAFFHHIASGHDLDKQRVLFGNE